MSMYSLFERVANTADRAPGIALTRALLRLPAVLYKIGVALRNKRYSAENPPLERLDVPVISVGGLTAGGAGKTPVVRHLARAISRNGHRASILSRGYGRRNAGTAVVSTGAGPQMSWQDAGDEPLLLATTLPGVPVIVGGNRAESGRIAVRQFQPDVVLLDDGFQHRQLKRDLDIVVVDASRRDDYLLPAGALREPWSSLSRADLVVLTRIDQSDRLEETKQQIQAYHPGVPMLETRYRPNGLRRLSDSEPYPLDHISDMSVMTLAGIANPGSFERTLRQLGALTSMTVRYPDHHLFRATEVSRAIHQSKQHQCEWVVTTEKDAVRIPLECERSRILVLDIELEVLSGEDILEEKLTEINRMK
ncbi:MAG: tetraacyldisaccharide 4'-kinase [Candidatus Latescibacteria bacterium]|jgi:tetraacyldisaccharide 4'-kinase|nr:tetraacyldisaccharide 4'-kinase [Candidatus Latescibacterota bacterium]